jgi:hypothetical protein
MVASPWEKTCLQVGGSGAFALGPFPLHIKYIETAAPGPLFGWPYFRCARTSSDSSNLAIDIAGNPPTCVAFVPASHCT